MARPRRPKAPPTLEIDFVGGTHAHRRRFGGRRGQPLARAIGISGDDLPSVLDVTAGAGTDSFVIATAGCTVTMIERHPTVYAELKRALEVAQNDPETAEIANRITVLHHDSIEYLKSLSADDRPDVVYMDPMYPKTRKTAASKKDMQALQALVGPDTDSEQLLEAALAVALQRVVVKRPIKAEDVGGRTPSGSVMGPNTRYSVYGGAHLAAKR